MNLNAVMNSTRMFGVKLQLRIHSRLKREHFKNMLLALILISIKLKNYKIKKL